MDAAARPARGLQPAASGKQSDEDEELLPFTLDRYSGQPPRAFSPLQLEDAGWQQRGSAAAEAAAWEGRQEAEAEAEAGACGLMRPVHALSPFQRWYMVRDGVVVVVAA